MNTPTWTTPERLARLRKLYAETGGKAWEPRDITAPGCRALVDEGFAKFVDGRCGFERFPNAMLAWTPAGRAALEATDE